MNYNKSIKEATEKLSLLKETKVRSDVYYSQIMMIGQTVKQYCYYRYASNIYKPAKISKGLY